MDICSDIVENYSQNEIDLHGICLLLQLTITEQSFYNGKTDKHNERKNTRCRH